MAQNKKIRLGPTAIAASAGNLYNPPTLTGGVNVGGTNTYILVTHLKITNYGGAAETVSLYIGGTGGSSAGTQLVAGYTVPAPAAGVQNYLDLYFPGGLRFDVADFLTGIAGAASALIIEGEAEIGIA